MLLYVKYIAGGVHEKNTKAVRTRRSRMYLWQSSTYATAVENLIIKARLEVYKT